MTYDPIDRKGQQAVKEQASRERKAEQEQLAEDVKWFMADPRGRRLMRRWLAFCHVDHTTFTGDSKGMFKEGARNVGLMLKAQITEHAFEDFVVMLREMQPKP